MIVSLESADSCTGFRNRSIKVGDTVLIPAGSSDPACAAVVAIFSTSWGGLPVEYSCLVRVKFSDTEYMYALEPAEKCE